MLLSEFVRRALAEKANGLVVPSASNEIGPGDHHVIDPGFRYRYR
jgi:hypothetical protein